MNNRFQLGFVCGANAKLVAPLELETKQLTKHVALFGASGSGKTGQLLSMVEENIISGIPTILIDIKGDLANIVLQPQDMREQMNFRLLTPGADHGEGVNIFAGLAKPDRLANSVSSLLKMLGWKIYDPIQSNEHAFLSKLLQWMHKHKAEVNLETLIELILEPPFSSFGALPLDAAVPRRTRLKLASKLNTVLVAPSFSKWREGIELNVSELFDRSNPDVTNVTVYSVAHLVDDSEREFAIALLLDEVLSWMRTQQGYPDLRASLVIDECTGIVPPYPANPPTKKPLMLLLKQARAFGLGLIVATQNTKDIDYKAMGNCETWIIGRLATKKDQARIIEAVMSSTSYPKDIMERKIAGLNPRFFVLVRPKTVLDMQSADVSCELRGPLTEYEMRNL